MGETSSLSPTKTMEQSINSSQAGNSVISPSEVKSKLQLKIQDMMIKSIKDKKKAKN